MSTPVFNKVPLQEELGCDFPLSLPLVLPSNCSYDFNTHQLIDSNRDEPSDEPVELKLVPETVKLLQGISKPVAVLSICGPFRSGKSYFLSRMLGARETFQLGHTMEACTRGIWMASSLLECEEFVLILLDTEGIDAPDKVTKLLVLTMLLSSMFIYNSKNVPRSRDLKRMSCLTSVSRMVEGDVLKQDQLALPDFLWLLRDVDTMPTGVDAISPTDYVKQILKKNKSYGVSSILEFFPSFNCLTIPPPSAAAAVLADITSNLDNLSVHFNRGVDAAVEHMLNTIRVKVGYGSSIKCDGSLLACLIEQYFTLINKPDSVIPTFQSSWLMAMEVKLRRVAESLVCEYDRDMRGELAGKLPMKEGRDGETGVTLMNIHLQVFAKRRLEYQDAIISFLSESHRTSAKLSDFESGLIAGFDRSIAGCDANMLRSNVNISGPLLNFVQENSRLSDEICTSLYNQKYIKLVNVKLQNAFSTQVPATIDEELGMLSAEYYKEARGPAVESVYKRLRAESSKLEADLLLIPGPVTNLKFAGIASDRVKLRWECPDFNPQAAEKYIVCIRTKGKSWMVVAIRRLCSVLIRGLKTRKRYNFAVLASNKKYTGMKFRHCSVETKISGKATIALTITTAILAPAGIVYLGGVIGIGVVAGALVAIQSYSKTIGDTTSVGCEEVDYLGESSAADSDEVALEDFEAHDYFAEVESEQLQDLVESEDEHV